MSGDVSDIRQQIRDLRPNDMALKETRSIKKAGTGSVSQPLMMEALRQEGLGPDVEGETAEQIYLPELSCIVIDLSTIDSHGAE